MNQQSRRASAVPADTTTSEDMLAQLPLFVPRDDAGFVQTFEFDDQTGIVRSASQPITMKRSIGLPLLL